MNKKTNNGLKIISLNRKASFNYFVEPRARQSSTTFSDGCLGSGNDEGRSEMR